MKTFLFWFFTVPIVVGLAIVATLFAVSNWTNVVVSFWPTPFEFEMPLALIALVSLTVGLLIGSFMVTIGRLRQSIRLRDRELEIRSLKKQLADSKERTEAAEKSAQSAQKALTDQSSAPKALPNAA